MEPCDGVPESRYAASGSAGARRGTEAAAAEGNPGARRGSGRIRDCEPGAQSATCTRQVKMFTGPRSRLYAGSRRNWYVPMSAISFTSVRR